MSKYPKTISNNDPRIFDHHFRIKKVDWTLQKAGAELGQALPGLGLEVTNWVLKLKFEVAYCNCSLKFEFHIDVWIWKGNLKLKVDVWSRSLKLEFEV